MDGDQIASADISPDTNAITIAGFVEPPSGIEPFTPSPGTDEILAAVENPSFSTSDSPIALNPDSGPTSRFGTVEGFNLPTYDPDKPADPIFSVGSPGAPEDYTLSTTSLNLPVEGFQLNPGAVGVDEDNSPSTEPQQYVANVDLKLPPYKAGESVADPIFNTASPGSLEDYTLSTTSLKVPTEGFKLSPNSDSLISSTGGGLGGVAVEKAPLPEKDLTLDSFKTATGKLSTDTELTAEEQEYFGKLAEVPLTANDWKLVTTQPFAGAGVKIQVPPPNTQPLSQPARQALQKINVPQQYRNPYQSNSGFNFGDLATSFTRALLNIGQTAVQRAIVNTSPGQVRVVSYAQRVPVPVPVTETLLRGVRVPFTSVVTLPGGVVTRILIYRPNTVKTSTRSTATAVSSHRSSSTSSTKPAVRIAQATPVPNVAAGKPKVPPGGAPKVQKRDMTDGVMKQHIEESPAPPEHAQKYFGSFSKYLEAWRKENANTVVGEDTLSRQRTLQAVLHPTENRNCNDEFCSQEIIEHPDPADSIAKKFCAAVKKWFHR